MKPKTIKGKEFLRQLSESSEYHAYEFEDMLNRLAICVAENANSGYSTGIAGLGTFKVKEGYCIKGRSNLTGEEYNTKTDKSLSFKVDGVMRNMLNEQVDRRNTLNTKDTDEPS